MKRGGIWLWKYNGYECVLSLSIDYMSWSFRVWFGKIRLLIVELLRFQLPWFPVTSRLNNDLLCATVFNCFVYFSCIWIEHFRVQSGIIMFRSLHPIWTLSTKASSFPWTIRTSSFRSILCHFLAKHKSEEVK